MTIHNRKLKTITFDLGGTAFQGQLSTWQMVNNTPDGAKIYTYAPDGEAREETDPDYQLEMTFFADWRSGGISDYLTLNDGETAAFALDHHPDIVGEHVRWTGEVTLKAPNVGGDVRTSETTQVTLLCIGKPDYSRIG
jgi:hypothetical protein